MRLETLDAREGWKSLDQRLQQWQPYGWLGEGWMLMGNDGDSDGKGNVEQDVEKCCNGSGRSMRNLLTRGSDEVGGKLILICGSPRVVWRKIGC